MTQAIITKNGMEFDEGILDTMIQYFADPVLESDVFAMAVESIIEDNHFEFVMDNDVYLIKTNTCRNCDWFTINDYCSDACKTVDKFC